MRTTNSAIYLHIVFKIVFMFIITQTILNASAKAQSSNRDSSAILKLNEDYFKGVINKDTSVLVKVMSDNFRITGSGGIRDRSAEIKDLVIPGYKVIYYQIENSRYYMYDCSAIVTGVLVWKLENSSAQVTDFSRAITCFYGLLGKQWKLIAQHVSRL